jgi:hypothetical protein
MVPSIISSPFDQRDVPAQRFQFELADVHPVDLDPALGGLPQSVKQIGQRALTAAMPSDDANALARLDLQIQTVEQPGPAVVREIDLVQANGRPGSDLRMVPTGVPLQRQVDQVTELVHARQQVVEILQLLADLGECRQHGRDDQLGRDQLTERQLAFNHQPNPRW